MVHTGLAGERLVDTRTVHEPERGRTLDLAQDVVAVVEPVVDVRS
jgi:hypothetical protein